MKVSSEIFCQMYFGVSPPCQGGVIAINGRNGDVIWKHDLPHAAFSLHCTADVNSDNITDCLVTGKNGVRIFENYASIAYKFSSRFLL